MWTSADPNGYSEISQSEVFYSIKNFEFSILRHRPENSLFLESGILGRILRMSSFTWVRRSRSGANIKCPSLQGVALGRWHVQGIEASLVELECKNNRLFPPQF